MSEYIIKTTEDKALMFYHYEMKSQLNDIDDVINKIKILVDYDRDIPPKLQVEDVRCFLLNLNDIKERLDSMRLVIKNSEMK